MTATRTGRILPEFLESPLDTGIERLRIDLDDAQLDQLPKHPAERWLSGSHIAKLAPVQCNYTVFPHLCIRAARKECLSVGINISLSRLLTGSYQPV